MARQDPTMQVLTARPDLMVQQPANDPNIGRIIKYTTKERGDGYIHHAYSFTIMGVQRIWDGSIAYRLKCNGFDDTFGSPMHMSRPFIFLT